MAIFRYYKSGLPIWQPKLVRLCQHTTGLSSLLISLAMVYNFASHAYIHFHLDLGLTLAYSLLRLMDSKHQVRCTVGPKNNFWEQRALIGIMLAPREKNKMKVNIKPAGDYAVILRDTLHHTLLSPNLLALYFQTLSFVPSLFLSLRMIRHFQYTSIYTLPRPVCLGQSITPQATWGWSMSQLHQWWSHGWGV